MNFIAYWIGFTLMASAGLAVMVWTGFLASRYAYRLMVRGMNLVDLEQALREWRRNHPERAARFARRNGFAKRTRGA